MAFVQIGNFHKGNVRSIICYNKNVYWCPTRFSYQMIFVSYYINATPTPVFSGVHVPQSLVFCIVLCLPLLIVLSKHFLYVILDVLRGNLTLQGSKGKPGYYSCTSVSMQVWCFWDFSFIFPYLNCCKWTYIHIIQPTWIADPHKKMKRTIPWIYIHNVCTV